MYIAKDIISVIEEVAPPALQESYDNSGLIIGNAQQEVTGALLCLDITEEVLDEAIAKNINLIISHHPLIFGGIKSISGKNEQERCIIRAIKSDLIIYACHTNIDNVYKGVNGKMAEKIGLVNTKILMPKSSAIFKLITFVPTANADEVRNALFAEGAGTLGNYSQCSFNVEGEGSFLPINGANPYFGEIGQRHSERETRIEVLVQNHLLPKIVNALREVHPYEEPAYDIIPLANTWNTVGGGMIGELSHEMDEIEFLHLLKETFKADGLKYTALRNSTIKRVALCGGSGAFMLRAAIQQKADIFVSADFKYHDYFQADKKIVIADIGHYESEQNTKELFFEIISKKMPNFAVYLSNVNTNPVNYL